MAYTAKSYVDITGLSEFLTKLKAAYGSNTSSASDAFKVNYAQHAVAATGDEDGSNIKATYLKQTDAASTYAAKALVIGTKPAQGPVWGTGYVDLSRDITAAQLRSVLNVGNNAEENTISTIKVRPSRATDDTTDITLVPSSKTVVVDLHEYAKLSDITATFRFRGIKATIAALPASGNVEGDIWHVTEDDGEYVWLESGDGAEGAHWELLSHNLSNYYTKSETYSATQIDNKDLALQNKINAIYTAGIPAQGDDPEVPASGVLADEITRATTAEAGLQSAINTLNGNDSTAGSVAKSIKDAIAGLDVESVGGSGKYIAAISEADGKISATATDLASSVTQGGTTPVTGGAVYTYVASAITTGLSGLDINNNGTAVGDTATASYVKVVDQENGLVTATAGAFDTSIPASSPSQITAPTTKAVSDGLQAVYNAYATAVTNAEIDALFPAAS